MMRDRADRPRAETKALAQSRQRAGGALIGGSDVSAAGQVALLKDLCRRLWNVLDRRAGADGLPTTTELFGELSVDAKAAVDPLFEAALIMFSRDRIYVEPCRRVIDRATQIGLLYLLVFPDGEKRVIREDELLIMAGLA